MTKKNLLLAIGIFLTLQSRSQTYPAQGISLYARWDDTTIAPNSSWVHSRYNSVVGWVDTATGHEYAIIGSQIGTHIIDLINPSNPVQIDFVPGRRVDCLWREYKIYSHYLYMVSDDAAPNSLQIADLSYLPDSVHVVYDSDTLFVRAHTIFIDGDKLYGGIVTKLVGNSPMSVYSLANPEQPQLLRSLRQDYPQISVVHDMYVKNDTIYASCGYQGLHIFTYNANNTFTALDSFITSNTHYNHSGAMSSDGHVFYFCEEVPVGQPVIAMNVSDPLNITPITSFYSHQGGTPHNPYIKGNLLYVAYYQEGFQVFNISDTLNITRAGYFDTFPFDTAGYLSPDYQGAWGAYVFLPSGKILVSDMQSGLFILNTDSMTGLPQLNKGKLSITISPNPLQQYMTIGLKGFAGTESVKLEVLDATGRLMMSQKISQPGVNKKETLATGQWPGGLYLLRATTGQGEYLGTVKFIKQ